MRELTSIFDESGNRESDEGEDKLVLMFSGSNTLTLAKGKQRITLSPEQQAIVLDYLLRNANRFHGNGHQPELSR